MSLLPLTLLWLWMEAGEAAGGAGDRELSFGNVELVPEKGEEKQNVGEMIVARGFATVSPLDLLLM